MKAVTNRDLSDFLHLCNILNSGFIICRGRQIPKITHNAGAVMLREVLREISIKIAGQQIPKITHNAGAVMLRKVLREISVKI